MSYFKNFGTLDYKEQTARNILTAVLPSRFNVDRSYVYQNYRVADGETPESIAEKFYKDSELYWVLLVINAIVNPFLDWPMDSKQLEEFVLLKYDQQVNGIHHYFDNRIGRISDDVDSAAWAAMPPADLPYYIIPKTNLSWERELNDIRREIVVVNPRYVQQFVEVYNRAIEGRQ